MKWSSFKQIIIFISVMVFFWNAYYYDIFIKVTFSKNHLSHKNKLIFLADSQTISFKLYVWIVWRFERVYEKESEKKSYTCVRLCNLNF